jgi:hypothetical protein
MSHTIQVQIILSNFKICNVPHHTGTNNFFEAFKTVICHTIQLFVPVWWGTLQLIKFDTICCAYLVRHINVQQLEIICGTMVWHSPVLKVLIHLFELTSCIQAHIIVSTFINCNVPHHAGTTNSIKS